MFSKLDKKDSVICQEATFKKYFTELNPENNRQWQRPRNTVLEIESIWYTNQHLCKRFNELPHAYIQFKERDLPHLHKFLNQGHRKKAFFLK